MKKVFSVVGIVSLILLAGFGVATALGYSYIGVKTPGQKATVSYRVCSGEIVDQFNKVSTDSPEVERNALKELADRVKGTRNNEEDPTCQTILFFAAFRTEDYQAMQRPMELVQSMYDKGIYVDSNLQSGYTVMAMSALLKEVIGDTKTS